MTLQDAIKSIEALKEYLPFINFLIGLFSLFVLWHIKNVFNFNSNIDNHKKKINEALNELIAMLNNYDKNIHDIEDKLILIDVELRAMLKGSSGDLLSDIKNTRALIRSYQYKWWFIMSDDNKNEKTVREIRKSLLRIPEQIEHVKRNLINTGK